MDHSPPGSSVDGIFHAILEWVAMPFSRGLPDPEIEPGSLTSPALAGRFFFFFFYHKQHLGSPSSRRITNVY